MLSVWHRALRGRRHYGQGWNRDVIMAKGTPWAPASKASVFPLHDCSDRPCPLPLSHLAPSAQQPWVTLSQPSEPTWAALAHL